MNKNTGLSYLVSNKFLGILGAFIIILILTFYPIINATPIILGIPNTPFNYAYRFFYLFLALYILLVKFVLHQRVAIPIRIVPLLVFWLLYSTRLIYDLSIVDIPTYQDNPPLYFYFYAFGGCLIPSIAVVTVANYIDIKKLSRFIYLALTISNLLLLILFIKQFGFNIMALSTRGELGEEGGIGPIYFSRFGAMLMIWSTYYLLFSSRNKIINSILFLISIIVTVGGASRGPLGFAFLTVILIVIYHWKIEGKRVKYYIKFIIFGGILLLLILFWVIPAIDWQSFAIYGRIEQALEEENPRLDLYRQGIKQFLNSPLIGDRFLLSTGGFPYVHNISLGALISTGMIGVFFYLWSIFALIYKFFTLFLRKRNQSISIFIFVCLLWFLMSNLSGAIYTSPSLWVVWFFILSKNKSNE